MGKESCVALCLGFWLVLCSRVDLIGLVWSVLRIAVRFVFVVFRERRQLHWGEEVGSGAGW